MVRKLQEPLLMLLFIAGLFGVIVGSLAWSEGVSWAWFVLGPSVLALAAIYWRTREPVNRPSRPRVPFATREQWIGIRGFVSGFALAIAIWAGMAETMTGRVISGIAMAVIGLCVYAGAIDRR